MSTLIPPLFSLIFIRKKLSEIKLSLFIIFDFLCVRHLATYKRNIFLKFYTILVQDYSFITYAKFFEN